METLCALWKALVQLSTLTGSVRGLQFLTCAATFLWPAGRRTPARGGGPLRTGDPEGAMHRGDPWEASAAHRRRSGRGGGTSAEDRKRRRGAGGAQANGQGLGLGSLGRRKAEYPPGVAGGPCVGGPVDTVGALAAVVTVTFNRAEYLERHVASLLDVHGRDRSNRRGPAHLKAGLRAAVRFLVRSLISLFCYEILYSSGYRHVHQRGVPQTPCGLAASCAC